MAIQVNGTTVIDNSRVLSNVTGLKTINSTSILGSGDIAVGASTTFGAVGTYIIAGIAGDHTGGQTIAGSALKTNTSTSGGQNNMEANLTTVTSYGQSGTWRIMSKSADNQGQGWVAGNILVRIS
jgi:hypothetical protein